MRDCERETVLRRVLERRASNAMERIDVWPRIHARLQARQRTPFLARLVPTSPLGWAAVGLALFLAIGAGGYSMGSTVGEKLFTSATGRWEQGYKADLVQELDQGQTISGITVTLERAYVLGGQVGIEYMVDGMPEPYWDEAKRYHHFGPTDLGSLTDEQGTVLRATMGTGVTGQSDILGVELPPGTGQYLPVFDFSQIDGSSSDLHLRFTVSLAEFISEGSEPPVVEMDNQSILVTGPTLSIEPLAGPFTFEFALPRTVDDER